MNKISGEIKSFSNSQSLNLGQNKELLKNFLLNFVKNDLNNSSGINNSYYFKKINLSNIIIEGLFSQNSNYIFICFFNKNTKAVQRRLFLLHIFFAFKNLYLKFSKILDNNESLFSLIFNEILIGPLINNFDNAYIQLSKKIDLIIFENSEYITSFLFDLNENKIIFDLGNLFQKNYKSSFFNFQNNKEIIEELAFHGLNLKNNFIKSIDKKIDVLSNCKKIELRATFPKPLFIIKFIPIFQGATIIHLFYQYKLAKVKKINPLNPIIFYFDKYKEIDISFFNLLEEIENDNNNYFQINIIEKFLFEYFLMLGNNIKEINVEENKNNSKIMTYKNRDYNLLYLNKDIIKIMKNIIMEYYKDETDLIFKLKKKFKEENNKNKNKIQLIQDNFLKNDNNNNINKNPLEFTYDKFMKEFKSIELNNILNNNDLIGLSDINIYLPIGFSNINEFSELNLSKDNFNVINRNITTANSNNIKEMNIYSNTYFYGTASTDKNNIKEIKEYKEKGEKEEKEENINTNEPFISEATNIEFNAEINNDESDMKSIFLKK